VSIYKNSAAAYGSSVNGATSMIYFDIRVGNATNGVDNKIYFAFEPNHFEIDTAFLDIQEYNAGLSYKQDGSKDQLIIVDPSGTVINL